MKRLFNPMIKALQNYYEGTTVTKLPRSKSRKVRKYAHVDITKDFERRSQNYDSEKRKLIEELYKVNGQNLIGEDGLIKEDMIYKIQNDIVELGPEDDIKSKYLVSGVRKMGVINSIKYRQISHMLFQDSTLHPETLKKLENLHYLVEHNLPVEKSLLFEMVPDVFYNEICKLPAQNRLLYETSKKMFSRAEGKLLDHDEHDNKILLNSEEDYKFNKIMEMEHYVLEQSKDVYDMYADKIDQYLHENNHENFDVYLKQLEVMDTENMLPWERTMIEDIYQLRAIHEDATAMRIAYEKK